MRKVYVIFLVLATVLLVSNFTTLAHNSSQTEASSQISSAGILAPPSVFPTNATFETKAEVIGNETISSVGGDGTDYYAQSFKALSDYLVNGGLWIEHYDGMTPNFRLMLCNSTGFGTPNVADPVFVSEVIENQTIDSHPGQFFLNLTVPMRVQQNGTYWLVIDGYYDTTTAGRGMSRWQVGDPYKDGYFTFSNDAGVTWEDWFITYDLDFIATFSNRPNKIEVLGTDPAWPVGGYGTDYYAQSFKSLDSYIVDAGVWLENYTEPTPNLRVQIWGNNATGFDHPDLNNVIASSRVIKGNEINSTLGQRFFVHPNVSIPVVEGGIYWLVIDGYYDHITLGAAQSRGESEDMYKDGEFRFSNDIGITWDTYSIYDLNFVVNFSSSQSAIKMMKGDSPWNFIGGDGLNNLNYIGQSFKALGKYIPDAGIWLENVGNLSLSIRLLICQPTFENASQPDLVDPLAESIPISIQSWWLNGSGMFYLKPSKPIQVVPGQTYFFLVDGYSLANATASYLRTYDRYQPPYGPYKDGVEMYSRNVGASWGQYSAYDLGLDMTFSDVPYEVQASSTSSVFEVGWQATTPYYAQSFIALNDYISDAGLWLAPKTGQTPNFKLLLVGNNATGIDHPNLDDTLATSLEIKGADIDSNPGMYYVRPSTPIPVQIYAKYWIVIDGSYDKITNGTASSRAVNEDAYPDGIFVWAFRNLNQGWHNETANGRWFDLQFDVKFTHVNQAPSQPPVLISPQSPFDSDDLYAYMPYGSIDFEQEPIAYFVEWYKNGVLQPAWSFDNTLPNSATSPTDDWTAKITPYDGHLNGTSGSYTVHVQADILTLDHPVTPPGEITYHIFTASNTSITGFDFEYTAKDQPATMSFTSTGVSGAQGFVNITIPKTLVNVGNPSEWVIMINGTLVPHTPPQVIITDNATYTFISVSYSTSSVPISIQGLLAVPEFTPAMMIITLASLTLGIALVARKITKRKR